MKVLIAPLNWGLGHASRCIPLVSRYLAAGDEVVLGGDGESLLLLRQHFPQLRVLPLAPLRLRYSAGKSQVWAMLRAIPRIIASAIYDHYLLRHYLRQESFDQVISDNRFGLFSQHTTCIYITHQTLIRLPQPYRWLEPVAARIHARVYANYKELWIPDNEAALSGELGHNQYTERAGARYIGWLSRFADLSSIEPSREYDVVAVLSGLEPHRSLLEQQLVQRFAGSQQRILIVRGRVEEPAVPIVHGNITRVAHLPDEQLASYLLGSQHIIARSGYSTIMDLAALGLLPTTSDSHPAIELLPTPGQPEQEYLARHIASYTNL